MALSRRAALRMERFSHFSAEQLFTFLRDERIGGPIVAVHGNLLCFCLWEVPRLLLGEGLLLGSHGGGRCVAT